MNESKFFNMKTYFLVVMVMFHLLSYSQLTSKNRFVLIERDLKSYVPPWIAYDLVYPVNHGVMDGYLDAQSFGNYNKFHKMIHLGADISSTVPGDEDLGDTICSIGRGIVITQWSNVVMIMHKTLNGFIVSQYRHCMEIFVTEGQYVDKAQPIARIGNEWGLYQAHLHFEIRTDINLDVEGGYGDPTGYVDPMEFIKNFKNR